MTTRTIESLIHENEQLRARLEEAEETLRAIRAGEVDAVVVAESDQVYTLESPDNPYRLLVEKLPHGAATLTTEGSVLSCNRGFVDLLKRPLRAILGRPLQNFVTPSSRSYFDSLLRHAHSPETQGEVVFQRGDGLTQPVFLGISMIYEGALGRCVLLMDLTERRRFEEMQRIQEALLAANQRLDLAQRAGRIGSFEWNIQSGAVSWSATQEELYGLPPGGFRGHFQDWQQFIHPDDRECLDAERQRAIAEQSDLDIDFRIVRPDGQTRWIHGKAKAYHGPDGEPLRVIGVNLDITDQKLTAQKLTRERELLQTIIDKIPVMVTIYEPDSNVLRLNPEFERRVGWSTREAAGVSLMEECYPDPDYRRTVSEFMQSCRDGWLDIRMRTRHGHTIETSWANVRLSDRTQVGIGIDITARKRAEQDAQFLAEASATLATLVDYQSALQRLAMLAVPTFADWCIIDVVTDEGKLRRLAVSHVDPAKVKLAEELRDRFASLTETPEGIWNVIRTGQSHLVTQITDELLTEQISDSTFLRVLKELGIRSYLGVPLTVRDKVVGVVTFIAAESGRTYDAADLAVAQDLVNRAGVAIDNSWLYQELHEADRRKDEFLATLAHELRNPLAPIRNAVQILKSTSSRESERQWGSDVIDRQVKVMARLLDDLLDLSRISQGKMELRKEPVELALVLEAALETSRPLIEAGRHRLTVEAPPEAIPLHADPVRLAQVFSNLLNNAAKYTEPAGEITLKIERLPAYVAPLPPGYDGWVEVSIKDSGIGIAPELLPRIFTIFSQGARALDRAQGGIGIGLSLVKGLVELHGGATEARSAGTGRGSEFVVRLPVASASIRSETSRSQSEDEPATTRTFRMLIVDDNRDAADSLAKLMTVLGHEAATAYDGEQAIQTADAMRPDVVLLDIGMPKVDGFEVCRRIRQQPWGGEMIIIAVTGWGQEDDRRQTEEAGFDHHLTKPVQAAALTKLLETLVK